MCISLMVNDIEHLLCVYLPFVYHLQRNVCSRILSFFILGYFNFEFWEFFIYFTYKPFLDTWFANIFSQSVACLFISFTGTFTKQKFLILMKFSLSLFHFMHYAFGVKSKNSSSSLKSCRFSPIHFFFLKVS